MPIIINLDVVMAKRKIGLSELADKVGITPANFGFDGGQDAHVQQAAL